jgi:hypothetical protein
MILLLCRGVVSQHSKERCDKRDNCASFETSSSLMILGWFTVPVGVSADWSTWHRSNRDTVDRGVLERDSWIHRVADPSFRGLFGLS